MNRLTRTPSDCASAISGAAARRRGQVPAVVGGGLLGAVGNEGALLRARRSRTQLHQVVERVALDVELGRGQRFSSAASSCTSWAADVALVGPRMNGDAVRARLERDRGGAHHARDAERARVAQQRDLVDVDRQGRAAARASGRSSPGGSSAGQVHRSSGFVPRASPGACAGGDAEMIGKQRPQHAA